MAMTPPAINTGPVDIIKHETGNDALTNHNGRPDMFVMVAEEAVQNEKGPSNEDEQHATAADEDDQLPDHKKHVENGSSTTCTCPFPS